MKKLFAISTLGLSLLSLLAPAVTFAAVPFEYWGPIVSCSGAPAPGSSLPKCTSLCDLLRTGQNVVKLGMTIAINVIAPFFFLWGGIQIMTAGGNENKVKEARGMMLSTVTGIAVTVGAYIIVNTFFYLMGITFAQPGGAPKPASSWSEITCSAS